MGRALLSGLFVVLCASNLSCGGQAEGSAKPKQDPLAMQPLAPFVVVEPPAGAAPHPPAASPVRHAYSNARVDVRTDVARTVVTDVFVNDSDAPVKLSYRFPLPNDATIAGFADFRDGQRFEAAIGDKDKAKQAFDKAESEGKHAGLAEADGAMGFHMALTPLSPHESRRVELTYVQTLHPLGGERTLVYPAGFSGDSPASVFDFDMALASTRPLDSIECPNQPDARGFRASELGGRVQLERLASPLERDLVIRWVEDAPPLDLAARAVRTTGEAEPYVEARFSFTKDPYADAAAPRDVVFVVDTSLSMAGDALDDARQIVEQGAANLSARDRVALVTFDAVVRSWSALAPADDTTKKRLGDELRPMLASGASNLDAAVDRAHELLKDSGRPVLVIATDGQPTVGEDLDRLTPATPPDGFRGTQAYVALFNYPSRQKAMEALFPNVTSVYVPGGQAAQAAVRKIALLASAPTIDDLHVDVDGLAPETRHGRVPPSLAVSESLRIVGRATGPVTVRVSGTLHGKPVALSQAVAVPEGPADDDTLPVEWARARIADLEASYRESPDTKVGQEIEALGTKYHLVSSRTSLLAADSLSPDRIMPGDPELRIVAPRAATGVRGVLPWGETVPCEWSEDEGVWFGRFLVPRGYPDGLYKVRVFMDLQGLTSLRTTLYFRVDSKPPEFDLRAVRDGASLRLEATAMRDVFDSEGSSLRKDLVDVKSVVVRLAGDAIPLERVDDDHWGAVIPMPGGAGPWTAEIVATDYARNTSTHEVALRP